MLIRKKSDSEISEILIARVVNEINHTPRDPIRLEKIKATQKANAENATQDPSIQEKVSQAHATTSY